MRYQFAIGKEMVYNTMYNAIKTPIVATECSFRCTR